MISALKAGLILIAFASSVTQAEVAQGTIVTNATFSRGNDDQDEGNYATGTMIPTLTSVPNPQGGYDLRMKMDITIATNDAPTMGAMQRYGLARESTTFRKSPSEEPKPFQEADNQNIGYLRWANQSWYAQDRAKPFPETAGQKAAAALEMGNFSEDGMYEGVIGMRMGPAATADVRHRISWYVKIEGGKIVAQGTRLSNNVTIQSWNDYPNQANHFGSVAQAPYPRYQPRGLTKWGQRMRHEAARAGNGARTGGGAPVPPRGAPGRRAQPGARVSLGSGAPTHR